MPTFGLKISIYSIPLTVFKRISIHSYCCKSQSQEKSLRPRLVSPLAAVWPRPPPHLTVISVIYILQPEKCIFLARRRGSGDITIIWSELGINKNAIDGNKQSPLSLPLSHTWRHCLCPTSAILWSLNCSGIVSCFPTLARYFPGQDRLSCGVGGGTRPGLSLSHPAAAGADTRLIWPAHLVCNIRVTRDTHDIITRVTKLIPPKFSHWDVQINWTTPFTSNIK